MFVPRPLIVIQLAICMPTNCMAIATASYSYVATCSYKIIRIYNQAYKINFLIILIYELPINLPPQCMTTFHIMIKTYIVFRALAAGGIVCHSYSFQQQVALGSPTSALAVGCNGKARFTFSSRLHWEGLIPVALPVGCTGTKRQGQGQVIHQLQGFIYTHMKTISQQVMYLKA